VSEFFTEFGLFFAETVTVVIAVLIIISGIVSASSRGARRQEKGDVRITNVNDIFEEYEEHINDVILDKEELKKLHKEKKKEDKEKEKAAKSKKGDEEVKPKVFVLDFNGDIKASQGEALAREITTVLTVAKPSDEVVLRLESPGGIVHEYGYCASQLHRIKKKQIPLTICVDKVAASGGYLMACLADKIYAAPFAILGSIGVMAQVTNFHRLLKKNDVDVDVMTAGEFKRTVSMFGEITESGRAKFQEELEETHELFKNYVNENRPQLEIEHVATGEHWFGTDALKRHLVDDLFTSDEYLIEKAKTAAVYHVKYEERKTLADKLGMSVEGSVERSIFKAFALLKNRYF
jgi:serine protease SohB